MDRTWPGLLATGALGGVDISIGVFALLLVHAETGNVLLSALAFTLGFIAVTLASSELFTENFLVPIAAVVAGRSRRGALLRLWVGTAVTNLIGGWIMTAIVIGGLPGLGKTAVEVARFFPELGIGWRSFALALLGGTVITLMTWMERGTKSVPAKLVAAAGAAFLLAAAPLNHAIVVSLEMFAAFHAGAPFSYLQWLGVLGWASLGNIVGGVGLVTVLRLVQVGRGKVEEEKHRPRSGDEAGASHDEARHDE
ncbi:formate/nitrite transporter family protein [soil metagenome]